MVELIWEPQGVLRRFSGEVTSDQLDASARQLQASDRIDTLRYIIHDFTAATAIHASPEEVEFMAVRASVALLRNTRVRIAFAGEHPIIRALIDAFNGKGISPLRCHAFPTLDAARAFTAS